jgi:aldose 1-epimerase
VIGRERFGTHPSGRAVDAIRLTNRRGLSVRFLSYGGIIQSVLAPDRHGAPGDVVLGFDTFAPYLRNPFYFGALIGRSGNRIAYGRFTLHGREYTLTTNDGPHHLHGGARGFHQALWDVDVFERDGTQGAVLSYTSSDGDDGYPGNVHARVTYTLAADDRFTIDYSATTDAPTPVNLTQHSYFNLTGRAGDDVLGHALTINASRYTPVDRTLIPLGAHDGVDGTPFDFRLATPVGRHVHAADTQLEIASGYDHNFVLDGGEPGGLGPAARVHDPESGRVLEVSTTEPGLQFYAGGTFTPDLVGKGGLVYPRFGGMALETQHFPDAPNQPSFPSTILRPNVEYRSTTRWAFLTDAAAR